MSFNWHILNPFLFIALHRNLFELLCCLTSKLNLPWASGLFICIFPIFSRWLCSWPCLFQPTNALRDSNFESSSISGTSHPHTDCMLMAIHVTLSHVTEERVTDCCISTTECYVTRVHAKDPTSQQSTLQNSTS